MLDAETDQTVERGQIELSVRTDEMALIRQGPYSGGQFHFSAPQRLLTLKVSAPGYHDWYGNGSKEQPELFAVQLEGHLQITIRLRPAIDL